jgi:16S rRNA (cytidine1402-2'-O)-methyltransferase
MSSNDRLAKAGILYVVGVPIGQLDDMTLRALRILGEADLIASEDTAATQRLLSHHGIEATLTSYGPTNIKEKVAVLIDRLQRGTHIALVSDCGSPVIADPGCLLVASAHSHGIQVISAPGPSALTAAVAATGLSSDSFFYLGKLPETKCRMRRCLVKCLKSMTPTIAFCTATSLALALRTIAEIVPRRFIVLACDITKPNELIIRGTSRQVQQRLDNVMTTQDITLILTGGKRA